MKIIHENTSNKFVRHYFDVKSKLVIKRVSQNTKPDHLVLSQQLSQNFVFYYEENNTERK